MYRKLSVQISTFKEKRIRNKWKKKSSNFKSRPCMYVMGSTLICHPSIYLKIKEVGLIETLKK